MTELKTLKDFDIDSIGSDTTEDLRREAVKWVKAKRKTMKMFRATDGEDFMQFFNINEEDLK